ncbi:MAG TPA: hypothetical protein VN517_07640 [Terriglobales bacterium]|nr:hypothetical protein [Terriglobales bacterium]
MRRLPSRWLAWWYLTIALGFLLLAARYALLGEKWWFVGLRVILAAGFAILSYAEFRGGHPK